jgi:syntaxin-binding protein 5
MDNLSQSSANWAGDVNKFVSKQKRGFVMGAVKSKFGF